MLDQPCPAKVLQTQNQNRWSKRVDSYLAQHWTFLLCDNEDDDGDDEQRAIDSLLPKCWFYPHPHDSKGPRQWPPLFPAWTPTKAHVDLLAGNQWTSGYTVLHPQNSSQEHLVWLSLCLSVWFINHPTTIALPEIAVRDYLFGEPHLFFKWPYLSLKKRHLGTKGLGMFSVFKTFCVFLSDLSSRHRFVTEDTGHLLFSAFSWWSLYYVKASVP